jgi:serine protease Do
MATSIWQAINEAAGQVVESVQRSIVQIRGSQGGIGAGTIWHTDGLILTSAHVITAQPEGSLKVLLSDGTTVTPQIIALDREQDIAALHIDTNGLPAIQIGRSRDVMPGQWLMALGHPWGVPDALTAGIVIGTGRELPQMSGRDWLALDMSMRPGHSGGPVFTPQGEMVGINTLITGPQVSFAVPVDAATLFLKESLGSRVSASITRV